MQGGYQDTAYPVLDTQYSARLLEKHYRPTDLELSWASAYRKPLHRLGFLIHLKLFQRMGYFVVPKEFPLPLIRFLMKFAGVHSLPTEAEWSTYSTAASRYKQLDDIRANRGVRRYTDEDEPWLMDVARKAAQTKDNVSDIINVMLEELVRFCYELPSFFELQRIARLIRNQVNTAYFKTIAEGLSAEARLHIDTLLQKDTEQSYSAWQQLKREPKKPGAKEINFYLQHVAWLLNLSEKMPDVQIPAVKLKQFLTEAQALDVREMRELKPTKRYALAVLLIRGQKGKALDDVTNMLIRMLRQMESLAQKNLDEYILKQQKKVTDLIQTLRAVTVAYEMDSSETDRLDAVGEALKPGSTLVMSRCDEYLAYSGNNFYPFMLTSYRLKRGLMYRCLDVLQLQSATSDDSSLQLLRLLLALRNSHKEFISEEQVLEYCDTDPTPLFPAQWAKLVKVTPTNDSDDVKYHRKYLELAIWTLIKQELESGDLHVLHGQEYYDHREEFVSVEEYLQEIDRYAQEIELPVNKPDEFIDQLKSLLTETAQRVDARFPANDSATLKSGRLSLKKGKKERPDNEVEALKELITGKLETTSIVDILTDTEHWLDLHKIIYPHSGNKSRLDNPQYRFITTLFCYGCNLGPTQTARSIKGLSPRQVAWLNIKQVSEVKLEKAITKVINAYNQFDLPKFWGDGSHASADGTKWELYEQNMMSQYHIRYGGYGGIGYYHVSDTYIALFSHFIPCGTYEGVYILDVLQKNESDIQPDTLHGDTHAQSYTVFGLSHLLGIKLMPRIRNIHDLRFFRPDKNAKYQHIDSLFSGSIDFELIRKYLPDMLRVMVSIKLGRITPSTLLKRLGTYSRKNKLYFAFKELGKVIRTIFLLNYIDDPIMRQTIHAETNKTEEFHQYKKWLFFGGERIIAENIRYEQQKIVKYNQLVANMVILYTTAKMTQILKQLTAEGYEITQELLGCLAPYWTSYINRFGDYNIDVNRPIEPMVYQLEIPNEKIKR